MPSPSDIDSPNMDGVTWVTAQPPTTTDVIGRVLSIWRTISDHRDLISSSVKRELASRFQGTLLGFLWPLVHPMFIFAVYYFIFTKLLSFKMPLLDPGQESAMGVYMFIGVVIWAAFGESIGNGCNVIVENGNLIKKLAFPTEILPLNLVLSNVVTMLFGILMFVLATVVTDVWAAPGLLLLWIPVLVLLQIMFTYGIVLFLSTMQVFLRDTAQIVSIGVTVWMFLTPLFWVPEAIPEITPYLGLIEANPMHHLVLAWREVLMGVTQVLSEVVLASNAYIPTLNEAKLAAGEPLLKPLVSNHDMLSSIRIFACWAVGAFVIGYSFFVLAQRRFADEV